LPGQPFYGVKRATEGVQLAATVGTEARGKRHLDFARTRLAEVNSLSQGSDALGPMNGGHVVAAPGDASDRAKLIVDTLHAMDVETRAGANDLYAAFRDSGSTEPLRALDRFTQRQYGDLHAMLSQLPSDAQPSARSSLALLAVIATDTVHSATGAPAATSPGTAPAPGATTSARPTPTSNASAPAGSQTSPPATTPSAPTKGSTGPLPLPLATTNAPVPAPTLPTIPPLPLSSPLPTSLPTLPDDLTGLLGH
jgi:hypothetical protein